EEVALLIEHSHIRQAIERLYPTIGHIIPAHRFQAVRHALSGFDKQHTAVAVRTRVLGRPKVREAGRLEASALQWTQLRLLKLAGRFGKTIEVDGHWLDSSVLLFLDRVSPREQALRVIIPKWNQQLRQEAAS